MSLVQIIHVLITVPLHCVHVLRQVRREFRTIVLHLVLSGYSKHNIIIVQHPVHILSYTTVSDDL